MSIIDANYLKNNPKLAKAVSNALSKQPAPKIGVFKALKVDQSNGTEDGECFLLANYLSELKEKKLIKEYSHLAQETYTPHKSQLRKKKLLGVTQGVPDYIVITHHEVLFIEMKRSKGGVTSPFQQQWLAALQSVGIKAVVCHGFIQAKLFLDKQLTNHSPKMVFDLPELGY